MSDVPHNDSLFHKISYDFPHDIIVATLEKQLFDHFLIMIFLPLIILTMLFSIVSIISLIIFVIARRTVHLFLEKARSILRSRMQPSIIKFLDDNDQASLKRLRKYKSNFEKGILINELLQLEAILIGQKSDRVKELYKLLNLYQFSFKKLDSVFIHNRIYHIRVLSKMNIHHVLYLIKIYISSKNKELRLETQLAILNLNHKAPFEFLDSIKLALSEWHQLVIYDTVIRHAIPLPQFKYYINRTNKSGIVFCLRMIRKFKQKDAYGVVENLLTYPSKTIQLHALITLGELKMEQAVPILIDMFKREEEMSTKIEIVKNLAKIGGEKALDFVLDLIDSEDFQLQMEVFRAYFIIDQLCIHKHKLVELAQKNEQAAMILLHCNDKRID